MKTSTTMSGGGFANLFYDAIRAAPKAVVSAVSKGRKPLAGALATARGSGLF